MVAGEYVSVSSQSDTEKAGLARERMDLRRLVWALNESMAAVVVG
jgi:VIT1/CCC1 family predicted Fe2+/Mn2+ transporter